MNGQEMHVGTTPANKDIGNKEDRTNRWTHGRLRVAEAKRN